MAMQSFPKIVSDPIQEHELKNLLKYSPISGEFTWKVKPSLGVPVGAPAGHKSKAGYTQIRIGKQLHYAHRLAFLYMEGIFPIEQVDHIDGNRANTAWLNLRQVSCLENQRNVSISKNNKSGVLGISWLSRRQKWLATIGIGYKTVFLGEHLELIDAITTRKAAELTYKFHPNHGRSIK